MKTKPLFITVLLLAIIAAALYFLGDRQSSPKTTAARSSGSEWIDMKTVADLTSIELGSDESSTSTILQKEGNRWIVPDYHDLPADFDKLKGLTERLIDLKIDRFVSSNPETIKRLNLGNRKITLTGSNGKSTTLSIGDEGSSGGSFIQIDDEKEVYLTRSALYSIDVDPENWPEKTPLSLQEKEIATLEIALDNGEKLTFTRDEEEADFTTENLEEDESIVHSKLNSTIRSLLSARFLEAKDPATTDAVDARNASRTIKITTFDNDEIELTIGRRPGIEKKAPPPAPKEKPASATTSVVFDSEGNIITPEEIERLTAEAKAKEAEKTPPPTEESEEDEEIEEREPGPVFLFYASDSPKIAPTLPPSTVALQFSDTLFNNLPKKRSDLIKKAEKPAPTVD